MENSDFQNSAIAAPTQTVQFRSGQASTLERAQAQANYTFRVEGQNRTSRQNIVFAGNLVPLPGTNAVTQPSLISNARITGTVTVDVTNQIKIDAVPASP